MDKKNKNKLEFLLEKVANERDLEIYDLNIQTNQNPIVIKITIKKRKTIYTIKEKKTDQKPQNHNSKNPKFNHK